MMLIQAEHSGLLTIILALLINITQTRGTGKSRVRETD
jgi:hypothetical protein